MDTGGKGTGRKGENGGGGRYRKKTREITNEGKRGIKKELGGNENKEKGWDDKEFKDKRERDKREKNGGGG